MKIRYFPIIAKNVKNLSEFYVSILRAEAKVFDEHYVEIPIEDGFTLGIESTVSIQNRSGVAIAPSPSVIEFRVDNVDEEYTRLENLGINIVSQLTTTSWGTRGFSFKDPDGNLLSFYSDLCLRELPRAVFCHHGQECAGCVRSEPPVSENHDG